MPLFRCTHELTSLNMNVMVVWAEPRRRPGHSVDLAGHGAVSRRRPSGARQRQRMAWQGMAVATDDGCLEHDSGG
jgi:hypothetical protein